MSPVFWLIVLCVMLALELSSLGLTTIWYAAGALVTCILSVFIDNAIAEWAIFLVGSTIALIALRPLFIDKFNMHRERTNIESIVGMTGRVTMRIDNAEGTGEVLVDGKEWTARSLKDGEIFVEGQMVKVLEIRGVKLIVEELTEEAKQ